MHAADHERERVREHLRGAERFAGKRDVSELGRLQRLLRALLLSELARYRQSGRFPVNRSFEQLTPHFVDAAATPCAVAHLLALSGEQALVQRIARERNHARVHELANEPRLVAWLRAVGLTLEEAAAIQPSYVVNRADCLCGGTSVFGAPSFGTLPARGVLIGHGLRNEGLNVIVRVDQSYGDTQPFAEGDEVQVGFGTSASSVRATTWAIPIAHDPAPVDDAGSSVLTGVPIKSDGTYTCMSGNLKLGPVERDQWVDALTAPDCRKALAKYDPSWNETVGGDDEEMSCSASSETGGPLSPLNVLLVLVATVVARRYGRAL
jgi:hypothetical protein